MGTPDTAEPPLPPISYGCPDHRGSRMPTNRQSPGKRDPAKSERRRWEPNIKSTQNTINILRKRTRRRRAKTCREREALGRTQRGTAGDQESPADPSGRTFYKGPAQHWQGLEHREAC